ncbi:MAG TPA: terminase family protein [Bryobacteraceae bacterium]|nr:terminase family protein [Bryobacteraceae bacterium]
MTRTPKQVVSANLRKAQSDVFHSPARFRVLVAGRRFGKTELALTELLRATWNNPRHIAWYVAPSYRQAKRIAWDRLKSMLRNHPAMTISETDLSIRLAAGGLISLRGADNYDSLRGDGLDFVVLDEFASMNPDVWSEVIRPALADRKGRALFIGTPQGHDHLYDRFQHAQSQPDWAAFHFRTIDGGNVTEEELASAAAELDERLYRQEFEASFETTALGVAYYSFSREENVRPCEYTLGSRLIWSLDFNVHPMCSIIAQRYGDTVEVLDEIVIEDANTPIACDRFWNRIRNFPRQRGAPLQIDIYGDASGHQRRTSGTSTDWNIIRDFFAARYGQATTTIRVGAANPGVRDRINVVNGRLCNATGERRLFIDPKCKNLILDFERVCWGQDDLGQPTSEIDKSDRMRTHLSDALGYYLVQAFPPGGKIGERRERLF